MPSRFAFRPVHRYFTLTGRCGISTPKTAETLAAARVSGVASFLATFFGGDEEDRTLDLTDANAFLYIFCVVFNRL